MSLRSVLRERLSAKVQAFAQDAATAIETVADESYGWDVSYADHLSLFAEIETRQLTPPSLGGVA